MAEKKRTKRAQKAEESRNHIYEVAIQVIAEKGFDGANIKDIVQRAGISVGAFYHHFGSKEGVLEENFRRADELFRKLAKEELLSGSVSERVVAYLSRYAKLVEFETGLELAKRLYTPRNKLFVKAGRSMQSELAALIDEGIKSGEIVSIYSGAEACDRLFVGARGLVFHWCLRDGDFDLDSAMRDYTLRALCSLGPLN